LAVVYGIVKQHEGYVNVYSEPGKGTTFRIYLPEILSAVREGDETPEEEPPRRGTETLLLAEDDQPVRNLIKTVLEEYGYTVIVAVDGEDAVNKYKENHDRIGLLLFDLIMPKKTGKEAYDEIRKIRPNVKIIYSSGYAPDIIRQRALIDDQVTVAFKPLSPKDLLKKVRSVLDGDKNQV
jgi:CheY-like chemotaxis protein